MHLHVACGALLSLAKSVDVDHVVVALVDPYDALDGEDHVHWHSCACGAFLKLKKSLMKLHVTQEAWP